MTKTVRKLAVVFGVLAAGIAVAAPASAVYDAQGNVIYIYVLSDGTIVY